MTESRRIAGLVGPSLIALTLPEVLNPHAFVTQTAPLVYLNGGLLFIAGLSILRSHNRWSRGWPVVVTLVGWVGILAGLFRLFFPELGAQGARSTATVVTTGAVSSAVGLFLTYKAYSGPKV